MNRNLSNLRMPADVQAEAKQKFEELLRLLKPWLFELSPEDRQGMYKMGDRSEPFVQRVVENVDKDPGFLPAFISPEDLRIDAGNVAAYRPLALMARQLCSGLEDGMMLSGSEAMSAALLYYGGVQAATNSGVPGAREIYEDLRPRFAANGRRRKEDSPQASAN